GARPLDRERKGISVAEGSALLLLQSGEAPPENAIAELKGVGLSCDAYHPAAPHPDGTGAFNAMNAALRDAGISTSQIDYINLHGTGTLDNDLSEARALHSLFGDQIPPLSSTKGAFGHSLAASGAIESVVSAISITENIIPANTGCENPDPELKLQPVKEPVEAEVNTVLSNSFGFGGNNASMVMSSIQKSGNAAPIRKSPELTVLGSACITGAGDAAATQERLRAGKGCQGLVNLAELPGKPLPKNVRRLKRLPRMALWLAANAHENSGIEDHPSSVFFGTAWGALTETSNFLTKLYESDEQFTSPTDFIGSVHNAPAGQVAMMFGSTGSNITTTGGDYSFEQALQSASLLAEDTGDSLMVIGADEYHEVLSGIFDCSVAEAEHHSDGGGALLLKPASGSSGPRVYPVFFEYSFNNDNIIKSLIHELGNTERINDLFGVILVGIPTVYRKSGKDQLDEFISTTGFSNPVIDYRKIIGEFASASAVAAVLALQFIESGNIPAQLCGEKDYPLGDKGILLLGLGEFVTAIEVLQ
ncbi:MAG: 3-oxoacyl-ACP synthase, partial [bacterium]|nr:3-oxoacyl-ACP synthase [bacterium]